jgi:hypothetical protein
MVSVSGRILQYRGTACDNTIVRSIDCLPDAPYFMTTRIRPEWDPRCCIIDEQHRCETLQEHDLAIWKAPLTLSDVRLLKSADRHVHGLLSTIGIKIDRGVLDFGTI